MIKYTLRCACDHHFEEWFSNSGEYDEKAAQSSLTCPACGGHTIQKAIMAPRLGNTSTAAEPMGCPAFTSGGCPAGCAHAHH